MHFFNPAPVLPLVEIIRAERSSDEAVNAAYEGPAGGQGAGASERHTGFIVNRVLVPTLDECSGCSTRDQPEDLDKAMTMGVGWPWALARS